MEQSLVRELQRAPSLAVRRDFIDELFDTGAWWEARARSGIFQMTPLVQQHRSHGISEWLPKLACYYPDEQNRIAYLKLTRDVSFSAPYAGLFAHMMGDLGRAIAGQTGSSGIGEPVFRRDGRLVNVVIHDLFLGRAWWVPVPGAAVNLLLKQMIQG